MRQTADIVLTARERQILVLLAEGLTAQEIGVRLGLSPTAVEFYKDLLYETLSVQTLAQLVRYAVVNGLV